VSVDIKLTRFGARPDLCGSQQVWPIRIQASGINIESDVFVYRVGKTGDLFDSDAFSCVASASQMYELPKNRALTLTSVYQLPFYRTSQMELYCRSQKEADCIWATVKEDVQSLLDNFNITLDTQPNDSVELTAQQTLIDSTVCSPEPGIDVVLSTNVIEIPTGFPVVVQALPPNASYAGQIWLQIDPVTGNSVRAYAYFDASDGGDDKWHSRLVITTGDARAVEDFVEAPGI
jgi:hypothetical protein